MEKARRRWRLGLGKIEKYGKKCSGKGCGPRDGLKFEFFSKIHSIMNKQKLARDEVRDDVEGKGIR